MAFGVLATVNGIGDFLSSAIVGLLWSVAGTTVAFGYSAALFIAGAVLVDRVARLVRAEVSEEERLATLTPREREVLEHVIAGQLNKQIAGDLGTVEHTIKVHRARVMEKMKAQSLAELVRLVERARAPRR